MLLWRGCRAAEIENAAGAPSPLPGPRTPAELAEAAGVTRATMTGLIDTLERDGLVTREPDPHDRRMLSVRITPKADAFLRQFLPQHFRVMNALMSTLSENERKTLVRLLAKISAQAATLQGGETAAAG
jgi:DNA-binding MarR family transcriptional regulator